MSVFVAHWLTWITTIRICLEGTFFSWRGSNIVDSRNLEDQGTLWNTWKYPYSTCQICRIQENINRPTTFPKWICKLCSEVEDALKILWERGEIAPKLLEISEVEIMRVDSITPRIAVQYLCNLSRFYTHCWNNCVKLSKHTVLSHVI